MYITDNSETKLKTGKMDNLKDRKMNFYARYLVERIFDYLYWGGWPARIAYHLGFQGKVSISKYDIFLQNVPADFTGFRIAFASDFHVCSTTHPKLIREGCRALKNAKPDLLLLGGDFITLNNNYIDELAGKLAEIEAPLGRIAVLGNHDCWVDPLKVKTSLESAGIHVLINSNIRLPEPYSNIWICGMDDDRTGDPDPYAAFANTDGICILLMHAPDGLLYINNHQFHLAFCGHTHGGQIALPNGRPIVSAHGKLTRKYNHGKYSIDNRNGSKLIVSRGLGCVALPIRIFADSEIVVCDIKKEV